MSMTIAVGILGILNVWALYAVKQSATKSKQHIKEHDKVDNRLSCLERVSVAEDRLRAIIRDEISKELMLFELRLMNSGQLPPNTPFKKD